MNVTTSSAGSAVRFLTEILARYGDVDTFLAKIRQGRDDYPTVILPRVQSPTMTAAETFARPLPMRRPQSRFALSYNGFGAV
ncbi:hypothetical protein [Nocardia jejuensis]|uniref:hypothetical protein n=1 Tax=Nocardia jejuensis TaxID=328049 RepID=UPI00082D9BE9|nr:hypothetical protein [Nocardia jejuensis]